MWHVCRCHALTSKVVCSKYPLSKDERDIESLCQMLDDQHSVGRALPDDYVTLAVARTLFDVVIEIYPVTQTGRGSPTVIVENPSFQTGIFKVQTGSEDNRLRSQNKAIRHFRKSSARPVGHVNVTESPFAKRVLMGRKSTKME